MQSVVVERFLGPTVGSYYGKFSAHESDVIAHVRDFESRLLPATRYRGGVGAKPK